MECGKGGKHPDMFETQTYIHGLPVKGQHRTCDTRTCMEKGRQDENQEVLGADEHMSEKSNRD